MSAAARAIRRKRLIRKFREAGATDPAHAVTLDSFGERRSWVFDQMMGYGVFIAASNGGYFMDEQAAHEFLRRQRMRAIIGSGVLVLAFLVLWACGVIGR